MTSTLVSTSESASRTATEIGTTAVGPRPVPELGPPIPRGTPDSTTVELDNGLSVLAIRRPSTPLVELRLRIPFAQDRVAPRVHAARAEVLASALLLGTSRRTRAEVDADIAAVGGHLEAHVDAQKLSVTGSVLAPGLPTLVEVLAEVLTDAAFRGKDVRGERARLVEHLAISLTQPSVIARRHLQHKRFGNHAAAWDTPMPEDVAEVTPKNVRKLFRRQVVPRGAILVLVGDLDPAAVVAELATALDGWRSDATALELPTPPALVPAPLSVFDHSGAVQSQVRLSAPAAGRDDPSYPAQQLANLVYGGYFSSRLMENLREDKGYTYGASSSVSFWPGRAALTVSFDTNTESTAPALWEAWYELGRLVLTPPSVQEVDAARNYALGTLAASLATQAGYASMMINLASFGLDAEWLEGYRRAVAAATVDEVHAVARTLFAPSAFTGIVVGDLGRIRNDLAAVVPLEPLPAQTAPTETAPADSAPAEAVADEPVSDEPVSDEPVSGEGR
jgi:zinc protease